MPKIARRQLAIIRGRDMYAFGTVYTNERQLLRIALESTEMVPPYYGATVHSYNFALIEIKNQKLFDEMALTIFKAALNCQNKISWRTQVYPDTGIGNLLGTDSLLSVENICYARSNHPRSMPPKRSSRRSPNVWLATSST